MSFAGRFLYPGVWKTEEVTTTDNSTDFFPCSVDVSVGSNWADGTAAGDGLFHVEIFAMARDATSHMTISWWRVKKYQYQGGTIASDGSSTDFELFKDAGTSGGADFSASLFNVDFTGTTIRARVRGGAAHTQKWAVSLQLSHYKP